MRIIRSLKTLIKYYKPIILISLVVTFMTTILGNILPLIGMVLLWPLKISVAYVMLNATKKPSRLTFMPLYIGLKPPYYPKNVYYMAVWQVLYLLPALIGAFISRYLFLFVEIQENMWIIILNVVIFSIPSVILSLTLAMVPFLLADPTFNQREKNPLKESAKMLKGSYVKLITMRLFFIPWLLWFASGFLVSAYSLYSVAFGGEPTLSWVSVSWLASLPFKLLLIDPWYQMTHADLYVTLRKK